ncbi:MAG: hypothetical protein OEO20_04415 [Gemmatimonadota bacterium]|nr:hypothetical protein [Gemmatimonadota bacterium]MDH3367730.1 hypothetical protein [Gemmatimonadota bacterium]MDH3477531.1 hypothetical protein [Gemmatimonadota bacterium]MDH3570469.1 hypothetical protein [Gemmatimonadota bacterium]MDH5549174.1 hypothetical protein [Gemmatimonadota bacterium]
MSRSRLIMGLALAIGFAGLPGTIAAQHLRVLPPRHMLGINGTVVRPVGEFQQFVDWGGGLGMYGVVNLSPDGLVGLRFDGSFVIYGHERYATPLSPWVPRVWVDVNTDNMILSFGLGPQLTFGNGPIRPYVFGTAGLAYFTTVSSVKGADNLDAFAQSTNFDDVTAALTGGAGMLFRLTRGRHPVSLDLSVQSTHHGEADYLRRGSIVENPDGSLTLYPIRSETNIVTFRAGIAIGL